MAMVLADAIILPLLSAKPVLVVCLPSLRQKSALVHPMLIVVGIRIVAPDDGANFMVGLLREQDHAKR
jgi:hypothetical protein